MQSPHSKMKTVTCPEIDALLSEGHSFTEMKSFFVDSFGSIIPYPSHPEEAFRAMKTMDQETQDLQENYRRAENEFRCRWWVEHIAPNMKEEAFSHMIQTLSKYDFGEEGKLLVEMRKYLEGIKESK